MKTTKIEKVLTGIKNIVKNWEQASDWHRKVDGFDGLIIDDILTYCKESEIFAGYEIYDIIMKIDGEDMTEGEIISLAGELANSMIREDKYWELVPNLDFRQDDDDWRERYKPVQCQDGDLAFETYGPSALAAQALAAKFADNCGTNACQHIWTSVDAEGTNIVLNGWHIINNLEYLVCEKPWGNGNKTRGINIEAKY